MLLTDGFDSSAAQLFHEIAIYCLEEAEYYDSYMTETYETCAREGGRE